MGSPDTKFLRDLPGSTIDMSADNRSGRERAFSYAVGQMISHFSNVEVATVYLIASITGIRQAVLKSIVYPLRIDNAVSTIRRTIAVSKTRGKAVSEILKTLDQLLKINKLRNDLLHLGTFPTSDAAAYRITNKHIAFSSKIVKSNDITISTIRKADHDLVIILYLWFDFIIKLNKKSTPKEASVKNRRRTFAFVIDHEAEDYAKQIRKSIPLGSELPWLYIPRQPKGTASTTRRKRQKPTPQPQSSRA